MYTVTFKDDRPVQEMEDMKAERILLFSKQGMFNSAQRKWFDNVKSINKVRQVDQHTLHLTKDIVDSNCDKCRNP